jgi:hypothetical protein
MALLMLGRIAMMGMHRILMHVSHHAPMPAAAMGMRKLAWRIATTATS